MKTLLIIPLFFILFSCNYKSNTTQAKKESVFKGKEDTIVSVQVVPAEIVGEDYIEKEYSVVVKSDTSSFSCIITENKINGKMSMRCRYAPYGKMPNTFFSDDTAVVTEQEPVKKFNNKLNYKNQIREIELILSYASSDFNLSKLSNVRLAMLSVDGLSQSVTKQYISQYGEKFPSGSNQKVAALIENSQLTTDLNNILSPYSVIVNKISIDDLMYYKPQDSQAGAKQILDGMIIVGIKPILGKH